MEPGKSHEAKEAKGAAPRPATGRQQRCGAATRHSETSSTSAPAAGRGLALEEGSLPFSLAEDLAIVELFLVEPFTPFEVAALSTLEAARPKHQPTSRSLEEVRQRLLALQNKGAESRLSALRTLVLARRRAELAKRAEEEATARAREEQLAAEKLAKERAGAEARVGKRTSASLQATAPKAPRCADGAAPTLEDISKAAEEADNLTILSVEPDSHGHRFELGIPTDVLRKTSPELRARLERSTKVARFTMRGAKCLEVALSVQEARYAETGAPSYGHLDPEVVEAFIRSACKDGLLAEEDAEREQAIAALSECRIAREALEADVERRWREASLGLFHREVPEREHLLRTLEWECEEKVRQIRAHYDALRECELAKLRERYAIESQRLQAFFRAERQTVRDLHCAHRAAIVDGAIERLRRAMARRRAIAPSHVVPRLLALAADLGATRLREELARIVSRELLRHCADPALHCPTLPSEVLCSVLSGAASRTVEAVHHFALFRLVHSNAYPPGASGRLRGHWAQLAAAHEWPFGADAQDENELRNLLAQAQVEVDQGEANCEATDQSTDAKNEREGMQLQKDADTGETNTRPSRIRGGRIDLSPEEVEARAMEIISGSASSNQLLSANASSRMRELDVAGAPASKLYEAHARGNPFFAAEQLGRSWELVSSEDDALKDAVSRFGEHAFLGVNNGSSLAEDAPEPPHSQAAAQFLLDRVRAILGFRLAVSERGATHESRRVLARTKHFYSLVLLHVLAWREIGLRRAAYMARVSERLPAFAGTQPNGTHRIPLPQLLEELEHARRQGQAYERIVREELRRRLSERKEAQVHFEAEDSRALAIEIQSSSSGAACTRIALQRGQVLAVSRANAVFASAQRGEFMFEMRIESNDAGLATISVGIEEQRAIAAAEGIRVCWQNDGLLFVNGRSQRLGRLARFGEGDVLGIGVSQSFGRVFLAKNGWLIPVKHAAQVGPFPAPPMDDVDVCDATAMAEPALPLPLDRFVVELPWLRRLYGVPVSLILRLAHLTGSDVVFADCLRSAGGSEPRRCGRACSDHCSVSESLARSAAAAGSTVRAPARCGSVLTARGPENRARLW
jgi:hypothetical protein